MKKNNNSFFRKIYEWLNKKHLTIMMCCVGLITYIYTYHLIQALLQPGVTVEKVFKYLSPILIFIAVCLVYKITTTLLLIHKSKKYVSSVLSSDLTPHEQAYKLLKELDRVALYEFQFFSFMLWKNWIEKLHSIVDKHITDNGIKLSYKDYINFDKR